MKFRACSYTGCSIVSGVSQEGNLDCSVDVKLPLMMLKRVKGMALGRLDSVELEQDHKKDIVPFVPEEEVDSG